MMSYSQADQVLAHSKKVITSTALEIEFSSLLLRGFLSLFLNFFPRCMTLTMYLADAVRVSALSVLVCGYVRTHVHVCRPAFTCVLGSSSVVTLPASSWSLTCLRRFLCLKTGALFREVLEQGIVEIVPDDSSRGLDCWNSLFFSPWLLNLVEW